jgi:hypothetical protein
MTNKNNEAATVPFPHSPTQMENTAAIGEHNTYESRVAKNIAVDISTMAGRCETLPKK